MCRSELFIAANNLTSKRMVSLFHAGSKMRLSQTINVELVWACVRYMLCAICSNVLDRKEMASVCDAVAGGAVMLM